MTPNRWTTTLLTASACAALALSIAGCGKPDKPAEAPDKEPELSDAEVAAVLAEDDGGLQFDTEQAEVVLKRGDRKARHCKNVVPNAPTGSDEIDVYFDGPKGRIVDVKVGIAFQEPLDAMNCIKNAYLGEIIPPFDGKKTVTHVLDMSATPEDSKDETDGDDD